MCTVNQMKVVLLVEVRNEVTQEGRSFSFSAGSPSYLAQMSGALASVVLAFQLWGDGWPLMSWLDAPGSVEARVNARGCRGRTLLLSASQGPNGQDSASQGPLSTDPIE